MFASSNLLLLLFCPITMKNNYNVGQQLISRILVLGFLLQSCFNTSIPSMPAENDVRLNNKY